MHSNVEKENIFDLTTDEDVYTLRTSVADDTWSIASFDPEWDRILSYYYEKHPDQCVRYMDLNDDSTFRYEVAKDMVYIALIDPDTGKRKPLRIRTKL